MTQEKWLHPSAKMRLSKADLHVWRTNLERSPEDIAMLRGVLSADEIIRADRFAFDKHRRRFTVSRGTLRLILSSYLNLPSSDIQFHTTSHGKPYIMHMHNGGELCFNVSHSHEMALYGFTLDRRLGVDIEYRRYIEDAPRIAAQFFSKNEAAQFNALSDEQQQDAFLNCWTRKEAYIKAIGEGLSHPLGSFDVSFLPHEPARLLRVAKDYKAVEHWSMSAFSPHPDYVAALIIERHDWRPTYYES